MNYKNAIRILAAAATILCAIAFMAFTVAAQEQNEEKKPVVSEKGRDPFKHYEPVRKFKPVVTKLEPPSISHPTWLGGDGRSDADQTLLCGLSRGEFL